MTDSLDVFYIVLIVCTGLLVRNHIFGKWNDSCDVFPLSFHCKNRSRSTFTALKKLPHVFYIKTLPLHIYAFICSCTLNFQLSPSCPTCPHMWCSPTTNPNDCKLSRPSDSSSMTTPIHSVTMQPTDNECMISWLRLTRHCPRRLIVSTIFWFKVFRILIC